MNRALLAVSAALLLSACGEEAPSSSVSFRIIAERPETVNVTASLASPSAQWDSGPRTLKITTLELSSGLAIPSGETVTATLADNDRGNAASASFVADGRPWLCVGRASPGAVLAVECSPE